MNERVKKKLSGKKQHAVIETGNFKKKKKRENQVLNVEKPEDLIERVLYLKSFKGVTLETIVNW